MKVTALVIVLSSLFGLTLMDTTPENPQGDEAAIKQAAMDYMEGWYQGNVERMTKALHPDLVKRTLQALPTGRQIVRHTTCTMMIEFTQAAFEKTDDLEAKKIGVKVLDVHDNIATALATSSDYYDYLQLARCNGKWVIVNVLWESNK